jgi:hypothetical protein
VLRKVVGPKGVEGAGDWGKLRNEDVYDFYLSPNFVRVIRSRRMILGGCDVCTRFWWVSLGRLGYRWDDIKMYLKLFKWKSVGWFI